MKKSYEIFARKYRPQTFEEMVGQKAVVQTLKNAIQTNRVAQAYLFSGMRGVGKTTAARILAKALNCQQGPTPTPCNQCEYCKAINNDRLVDVLEIDGASNRGVEEIGQIRDTAKYKPLHSRYKVIIIDEVHMLTAHAFNALLKTLEEPPEGTIFIFATTEFHKVPATIVSRCQHFEFKKIGQKDISQHLFEISRKEGITISPLGLKMIAEAAEGSLRDAQSLLDQAVAFSGEIINDGDLKEILGTMSQDILFECSTTILGQKPEKVFGLVETIISKGYDLRYFYKELVLHFRNLLLMKSVDNVQDLLPLSAEELNRLKVETDKASSEELLRFLLALQQGEAALKYSSHPQVYLEILLVKLCHHKKMVPLQDLLREMGEIKTGAAANGRWPSVDSLAPSGPARELKPPSSSEKEPLSPEASQSPGKNFGDAAVNSPTVKAAPAPLEREYKRERETELALKDPAVRAFMETFKAQILSFGPAKKPGEEEGH
jgi:DNA polymerase-3 subunit gamma/tau